MNRRLDEEDDDDYGAPRKDREISLGTTMLLGIFFALAMLCAVFFGFGYSLGSKHAAAGVPAAGEAVAATNFSGFKPSPGSPLGGGGTGRAPAVASVTIPYTPVANPGGNAPKAKAPAPVAEQAGVAASVAPIVRQAPPPAASTPVPVAPILPAVAATPTSAMVQVAAVSHQEDADLLISTLKRRGYNVAIRQEPQDKLLHVQIGPFSTRKDADAMRQKLLADGFNAIVK